MTIFKKKTETTTPKQFECNIWTGELYYGGKDVFKMGPKEIQALPMPAKQLIIKWSHTVSDMQKLDLECSKRYIRKLIQGTGIGCVMAICAGALDDHLKNDEIPCAVLDTIGIAACAYGFAQNNADVRRDEDIRTRAYNTAKVATCEQRLHLVSLMSAVNLFLRGEITEGEVFTTAAMTQAKETENDPVIVKKEVKQFSTDIGNATLTYGGKDVTKLSKKELCEIPTPGQLLILDWKTILIDTPTPKPTAELVTKLVGNVLVAGGLGCALGASAIRMAEAIEEEDRQNIILNGAGVVGTVAAMAIVRKAGNRTIDDHFDNNQDAIAVRATALAKMVSRIFSINKYLRGEITEDQLLAETKTTEKSAASDNDGPVIVKKEVKEDGSVEEAIVEVIPPEIQQKIDEASCQDVEYQSSEQ